MLTIFSNPRPFVGIFDTLQRNAIKSWMKLGPECEIILFEDEEKTTSKVAAEFGLTCITDVEHDEFGTALLSDVFAQVRRIAKNDVISQVNSDIILMDDFLSAVRKVKRILGEKNFFMIGRRWNLDVTEEIDFSPGWEGRMREKVLKEGKQHGLAGLDYWTFPKSFNFDPPPFVIGRPGMDSWLIYRARSLKVPVVDATQVVTIVHQNHNYPSKKKEFFAVEKQRNLHLAGGFSKMATLRDADWLLTEKGLAKPPFPRIILSMLTLFWPWRMFLSWKRKRQHKK